MSILSAAYVNDTARELLAIAEEAAARPRGPGKWSRKEILGHLIDSAVNNQSRFVRAQLRDDLLIEGYDQNAWVRVQRHQDRPWPDLVQTWRAYNLHIAAIMSAASPTELKKPRPTHNLAERGFRLPPGADATLEFLMQDYVAHMEHHIRQVLED